MTTPDQAIQASAEPNVDATTVESFGNEWTQFDQSALPPDELEGMFRRYFGIFPWTALPKDAEGFDMGCGSGRWARLVAPRVGKLNCIDASDEALAVARRALAGQRNVCFFHADANAPLLEQSSQDFGYALGVLHHIPDTEAALRACVALLKPGALFLVYLYYRLENRPLWFSVVWQASEVIRAVVSRLPPWAKLLVTDILALLVYWPLARLSWLGEKLCLNTKNFPLHFYRNAGFYTMRTDSRDRFGTPLERRFTRTEIEAMMERAGLTSIRFSPDEPFWVAIGMKQ